MLVAVSSCIVLVLFLYCFLFCSAFTACSPSPHLPRPRHRAKDQHDGGRADENIRTHDDPPTNQYESVLGGWWVGWIWLGFGPEVYANLYPRQAKKYFKKICPPDKLAEFVLSDFFTNSPHPFNLLIFFLCKALWYNQRTRQTAKNERLSLSNPQRRKAQCSDAPVPYLKNWVIVIVVVCYSSFTGTSWPKHAIS